ncbi:MAG TPA: leucine--tRNA ligase [Bacteroidetes bacterium]|nr:leucine--tRNA ligase [Bacteroidota bacterium]
MEYNFRETEKKWLDYWKENKTFKTETDPSKPKYYVLDMFPYPSGAGLHVGHPLGYIASDIYARYMRLKGYNVLHPMGFDAFGLPAEQYAIQTGTHPAITTKKNIQKYREQLNKLGFSFDWDREVITSDPAYYKWTQWTFLQLFKSWYNQETDKAEPIDRLIKIFEREGNKNVRAASSPIEPFSADEWNHFSEKKKQKILMNYRLAYLSDTWVNWCPALGTVLANDEVKDGYSERGGHPVERKKMRQWFLRITAYAQRLLDGLETIDWNESIKEVQRNWIGRSEGAVVFFDIENYPGQLEIFTTRPDTLFGATFMVLAPEHPFIKDITTKEHREKVKEYVNKAINRSERDRIADVKTVTGVFTGAYAINPVNGAKIPIWVAEYVLAGYGTGAIMAVPAHDSRDFAFARHFNLPIIQVVTREKGKQEDPANWTDSYDSKEGYLINSGIINDMPVNKAIPAIINFLKKKNRGYGKVNYRLRDAIFSRQRYWGEPFPIYYKEGIPYPLDEDLLPLELPEVDKYLPTETGDPPLARAQHWKSREGYPLETNTMPGFAGSSGYYLRYMDPHNDREYFSKEAVSYWRNVDLYIGGDEHATGHLIYSRFWNKFLFDLGLSKEEEPFRKLINQGKILGRSNFVYRVNLEKYAEYLLWKKIVESGEAEHVIRNYRDGNRRFDFYHQKAKLIVEIKSQEKLEKLESYYKDYIKDTGKRLILLPIHDIIYMTNEIVEEINCAIHETAPGKIFFDDHKIRKLKPIFVSHNIKDRELWSIPLHVDINLVHNDVLDLEAFRQWRPEFQDAEFILEEDGKYICGWEVEKMSKSKHNVQTPDELIDKYGADVLRMYEMFLGPIEQSKPWDTNGIEGISRFVKKFWRLFHDEENRFNVTDEPPAEQELKILNRTIKKVRDDIERFSFHTAVSTLMICTNELSNLRCRKRDILEPLTILISPFAPLITEELWKQLGHKPSISFAHLPDYDEKWLKEDTFEYPVTFNGKMRFKLTLPLKLSQKEVETAVKETPQAQKWIEGKTIRKVIFVPKRIINVVVN